MRRCSNAAWIATLALLPAAMEGCAARSTASSAGGGSWVRQEIWLGAEIPSGGEVTEEAWQAFVNEEVAPRFPSGFSVLEAAGHWRRPDGRSVRERTRVLVVLHGVGDSAAERNLAAIADAYAARFGQDAVLRTTDEVDVRFVEP